MINHPCHCVCLGLIVDLSVEICRVCVCVCVCVLRRSTDRSICPMTRQAEIITATLSTCQPSSHLVESCNASLSFPILAGRGISLHTFCQPASPLSASNVPFWTSTCLTPPDITRLGSGLACLPCLAALAATRRACPAGKKNPPKETEQGMMEGEERKKSLTLLGIVNPARSDAVRLLLCLWPTGPAGAASFLSLRDKQEPWRSETTETTSATRNWTNNNRSKVYMPSWHSRHDDLYEATRETEGSWWSGSR